MGSVTRRVRSNCAREGLADYRVRSEGVSVVYVQGRGGGTGSLWQTSLTLTSVLLVVRDYPSSVGLWRRSVGEC